MKPATLACLAILLLVPGTAVSRSIETRPAGQAQKSAPAAAPAATADGAPAPRTGERKRRTSYARCNRSAHERGLRGGVRRRFMIRCRLGYEKPRQPAQTQQAAPQQPPQNPPAQAAPAAPAPAAAPGKRP